MRPSPAPRPSGHAPRGGALELLTALSYELLDAHRDTVELAAGLPDGEWRAHVDYLRALQRRGHEQLAQAWSAQVPR